MVQPHNSICDMGQTGLCAVTAPQTNSLLPMSTEAFGISGVPHSLNGTIHDLQEAVAQLLENSAGVTSEEISLKLRSVINENQELKETIFQNNLALRQQLNLLVQWNQQVEDQQRHYRQTINDTHKQLAFLQQENSLLRSALSSSKHNGLGDQFKEYDETIQNLNRQIENESSELQRLLEENEIYLTQKKMLEGEITLLKCELTAVQSENERYGIKLHETSAETKALHKKLIEREKSLQIVESRNARTPSDSEDRILQQLQEARSKIESLEFELKVSRERAATHQSKDDDLSEFERSAPRGPPQASADRTVEDDEKRKLKDEAAMLREEVATLEAALSEEKQRTSDDRAAFNKMYAEISRLKKELHESRDTVERHDYNDHYYQVKIKSIQEQHDEATAKLVSYEELLGTKNDDIARLKKELGAAKAQLTDLKSEGETIAVLRAQVEVYQSDFRAEREAREALATDREKLRDELRHLHTRNTQLMDELETYQRGHFNQSSGISPRAASEEPFAGGSKDNTSLSPEALWERLSTNSDKKEEDLKKKDESLDKDENLLYCPKCNKPFAELRPLEEHVNRCLDED